MISFDNFLFRCSSLGKLMTYPDKDTLSAGPKTALKTIYKNVLFGKSPDVVSKYTSKGILAEDQAIELYNQVKSKNEVKNEVRYENSYITGLPDVVGEDLMDVKSPWDQNTFPLFEEVHPNKDYYWQMQGYMWLTNKSTSKLVSCLVDTPDSIIESEIRKEISKQGTLKQEEIEAIEDAMYEKMKFSNIDIKFRVKEFVVEIDDKAIDSLKRRIELSREYLNSLNNLIF